MLHNVIILDFRILLDAPAAVAKINEQRIPSTYEIRKKIVELRILSCEDGLTKALDLQKPWTYDAYRLIYANIALKRLLNFLSKTVVVETEKRDSKHLPLAEYKMQHPALDAALEIAYNAIYPHLTGFQQWLIDQG